MTIKKLTVAAAIAVGIATCSFSSAMAACPCSSSNSGGCPCQDIVTPATAPCPICGQNSNSCGCGCKTNTCGCSDPCCNNTPSCGCTPCCPKEPACGTCPSTSCQELDMKQVYAYPNAIYGDNNYVGEQTNAIYSTETAWMLDCKDNVAACKAGAMGLITGAAAPFGYYGHGYSCGCGCKSAPCGCANSGVCVSRPCDCGCNSCGCNSCLPVISEASLPCGCGSLPMITGAAAPCGCGCNSCASNCGCDCDSHCCTSQIQTENSMNAMKRSFTAFCPTPAEPCGCAAPLVGVFPDVPAGYWAGCDIDRLAATNVVAGYPDRTFKPSLPVSRAEFASMMVKGFNLNIAGCDCLPCKKIFKDVPLSNWANPVIAKAVEEGIMSGYCNGKFMPKKAVSRAEALTAMAHGINCDMDACKAKSILGKYCDGDKVPDWAAIPVAKALETGVLKDSPAPNMISPCKDASRADIASMLQNVRIAAGYDKDPTPTASTNCDCPAAKTAYMETDTCVKIPTLKVNFLDEINAKSSRVGQQFAARTTEEITLNGTCYPCGSRVNGKIVEVIRPSGCQKGALKVAFTSIEGCNGCKCDLPNQILSAQVSCEKKQNAIARLVAMPFTLTGTLLGTTGRTIGGMISNLGNAAESVSNGVGIASSELLQGGSNSCACACDKGKFSDRFTSAGRSLLDATKEAIIAPVDMTRTALSGTVGLFQTTGDEVAYLVDPKGTKISAINPKEQVTIAFGCK